MSDRWAETDALLIRYEKFFRRDFSEIKDELLSLFRELGFERDDLNSLSPLLERRVRRKVKEIEKNDYLDYLVFTYKNNQDLMGILIYVTYLEHFDVQFGLSKELLVQVANDIYDQGKEEATPLPEYSDVLGWDEIEEWAVIPTLNLPFVDYLLSLYQTDYEETFKDFLAAIMNQTELDLDKLIEKQLKRMISINDGRFSGVLEYASELVGNEAYVRPFPESEYQFVAVIDKRTTQMCESLDGQRFKSLSDNRFTRYSAAYGGIHEFYCKGLVVGLNCPPITDHFHYCRSHLVRV